MKGERLAGFDEAVLQHTKRLYLQSRPLTDADRVGQYAYLHHKTIPAPACCLYFLDKKYRLLEEKVLYSGVVLPVETCCSYLSDRVAVLRAAHVAVSMTRAATGMDRADLDRASRIALFCQAESISLVDVLWVDEDSYLPLCRYFGTDPYEE